MSDPLCPKCSTELKEDFGITDCPGCGTVCFVGMDGEVTVQEEESASSHATLEEQENEFEEAEEEQPLVEAASESFDEPLETAHDEQTYGEQIYSEEISDEGTSEESISSGDEVYEAESATSYDNDVETELEAEVEGHDVGEFTQESVEDLNEESTPSETEVVELNDDGVEEESLSPLSVASFLEELEVFASQSDAKDYESELFFDIAISEVGFAETKNILFETLSDSRLDLTEEDLHEGFVEEDETLYLSQVPYARAVVIFKRVLSLNLKIDWVQKEVHELEVQEEQSEEEMEYFEDSDEEEFA